MIPLIGILLGSFIIAQSIRTVFERELHIVPRVIAGVCAIGCLIIVYVIWTAAVTPDAFLFGEPVRRN